MSSTLYKKDLCLITACVEGDPEGWNRFIDAYGRLIRATVLKLFRVQFAPRSDVEDIENYVYEKLLEDGCRRLSSWRGRAKFSTYLVQVVRNLVIDHLKKENRGPRVTLTDDLSKFPDESDHPLDRELQRERKELLHKAIQELPPNQALIMCLRLKGKTLREIADITNRPVGTISVENSRALEKLRVAMKELADDEEIDATSGEKK
ncbi:MAG: sigma-70 family RNA polymerase sigma factor [Candidatus Hydrogenedentes bacterium]|nr:sigma-70 family RNA polymerase sigma factor [Candidatus Hydrogenedentota bacterium]